MDTGDPLLVDTGRGFSVYYRERHLYNRTSPVESAEKRAESVSIEPETVIFIPSPLLFYGVETILKKLPEKCIVIAYEHDIRIHSCLHSRIRQKMFSDGRLYYIAGSEENVLKAVSDAGIHNFRRVVKVSLNAGYNMYRAEYSRIQNLVAEYIREFWQNRLTTIHMAPLWIRNIFTNISYLNRRYSDADWTFPSGGTKPVVVTGAGESLEYSISDIISERNNITVLAVDTSLPVLFRNGIRPDFIVAVDSQVYNLYDFFDYKNSRIPVFFDLTCYPGIARNFSGRLHPFLSVFHENSLISRLKKSVKGLTLIPPLGSVGITAVYIALEITKGPVIHTGLDFSYSIGKSHAKDSPFILTSLIRTNRLATLENPDIFFSKPHYTAEDKNGNKCITNPILSSYAGVMKKNFGKTERLFDTGRTGIHTAGKRISRIREAADLSFPDDRSTKGSRITGENGTGADSHINEFFLGEIRRLDEMYRDIYSWLSENKGSREHILKILDDMDYLHIHFPDYHSGRRTDPQYLKRILVSAIYYRTIISRQLTP